MNESAASDSVASLELNRCRIEPDCALGTLRSQDFEEKKQPVEIGFAVVDYIDSSHYSVKPMTIFWKWRPGSSLKQVFRKDELPKFSQIEKFRENKFEIKIAKNLQY